MHPDTVNRIVGKVSSIKSKHKSENNDSKKLVHSMVEGFVGHPVNFDDHKEMINKVREKVEEVKSGKVPLSILSLGWPVTGTKENKTTVFLTSALTSSFLTTMSW